MPEENLGDHGDGDIEIGPEEQEAIRRLQDEIGRLSVADHVSLMMHSLSSLAVDRLGLGADASHRDLEQARMAVDAFKALLGVLEGRRPMEEINAHRSVLAQLQMTYVAALERGSAEGEAPDAEGGDGGSDGTGGGGDTP